MLSLSGAPLKEFPGTYQPDPTFLLVIDDESRGRYGRVFLAGARGIGRQDRADRGTTSTLLNDSNGTAAQVLESTRSVTAYSVRQSVHGGKL